jgi:DNA polymerase-3 subunit alpha
MQAHMKPQTFIHLHVHSAYSIVDGIIDIEALVDRVADLGMSAVALTDHCNLFAWVKFYQAARKRGIKPIIGADLAVMSEIPDHPPTALTLLCQNELGYRHLMALISRAYLAHPGATQPLIQKAWLVHMNQGLLALLSPQGLIDKNFVEPWSKIFPQRFYLEVTRTGHPQENEYIQSVVALAEEQGYPVVATNNVRFLAQSDFAAHETRLCIQEGYTLKDPKRPQHYREFQYLRSAEEMQALFADIPEALENTLEIAKRCTLSIPLGQVFLPKFPVPPQMTSEKYLLHMAEQGLEKRVKHTIEQYQTRLHTELEVINGMGFAGYFLIVADLIHWAKSQKIPVGPGRGSGAGSLVAYALEITDVDPLQYQLLFERFLNPDRVSMPDFDIDFCMEGRDRVIEYVTQKYGRDAVSQIITYGTMAAKAVIRDVGRVLGHPYGFVDKIAKLVPMEIGITLEKAISTDPLLKERYAHEEEVKYLIDLAQKLEGLPRNVGKHAGGVVIAPSQLIDFTPLFCDGEGSVLTQLDKNDIETIGLIKFDFLGLRTLTIIDWAVKNITHTTIDMSTIALNDPKTFALLCAFQTTAVFQLESRGMKDLIKRLQPDNFEEVVALVALYRPGPLQSGMVDDFINRKHGRAKVEYLHPLLTEVLKPTYGVMLYQEQVMQIAQILAGYTLGGADLLRRAMGKKKPEEMAKQRALFVQGAMNNQVPEVHANHIFDLMEKFSAYGFNKSHSVAYALLTYQTAWLKANYPAEFMAAVLSADMAHTDKIVIAIQECRHLKLTLIPPNINISQYYFSVNEDGALVYGLGAVKGVGEAAVELMLQARIQGGAFKDLLDFCTRVDSRKITRRVFEALIYAGALDVFGTHRADLMAQLGDALKAVGQFSKNRISGQQDLFGNTFTFADIKREASVDHVEAWPEKIRLQGEKNTLGFYLTGHPMDLYKQELALLKLTFSEVQTLDLVTHKKPILVGFVTAVRTINTRKGDRIAFVTLDDGTGRQEITVFSELYQNSKPLLKEDQLLICETELSKDTFTGGFKVRALNVYDLTALRVQRVKGIALHLRETEKDILTTPAFKNCLIQYALSDGVPVHIVYHQAQAEVKIALGAQYRIIPNEELLCDLKKLGIRDVHFVY